MTHTLGIPEELLSGEDHGVMWAAKPEGQPQPRRHLQKNPPLRRTFRRAHTRANESFKDATVGHVEQENDGVKQNMERIMRQDSNLSPYDGFRIGGFGKVLNQIGLNQRKTSHNLQRKLMFDIHPRIAYNLADQDFSRVLTLHQDFKRKDLMKEGNRPYSITYRIAYALSNTHHSDLFLRKEYIEIPRIFKEFAKQPVVGRYEGMLEIAGHEFLLQVLQDEKMEYDFGVLRREKAFNRIMPINFRSKRDEHGDKKDMQMIIKEHINLGLIEPGISAYSSPGFLLAIPQDEDELVVYTDANDYRWAAVLMKKILTGKSRVDVGSGIDPGSARKRE
ncbi:movement protein [Sesamum angolense]|uniref:Movement protein n=1 Tax=Sesamum angolense TaxID=2727404 RepID=A0AAE1WDL9_9LAMI|nr:movement protein [Sesamum angolense]